MTDLEQIRQQCMLEFRLLNDFSLGDAKISVHNDGIALRLDYMNLSDIALPASVSEHITSISIHTNMLTSIPGQILCMSNLRRLMLNTNAITSLPEEIGKLSKLEELHLSKNLLTELPESLCKLSNLKTLDVSDNRLRALPECIDQLYQLERLNLSWNRIRILPKRITRLERIKILYFESPVHPRLTDDMMKWIEKIRAQGFVRI